MSTTEDHIGGNIDEYASHRRAWRFMMFATFVGLPLLFAWMLTRS